MHVPEYKWYSYVRASGSTGPRLGTVQCAPGWEVQYITGGRRYAHLPACYPISEGLLVCCCVMLQAEPRAQLSLASRSASQNLKISPQDLILYSAKVRLSQLPNASYRRHPRSRLQPLAFDILTSFGGRE